MVEKEKMVVLRGTVQSGRGEAKGFMEIPWVSGQCEENTGFQPYPGTLNLSVDRETFLFIRKLAMSRGGRIIPPVGTDFCEARTLNLRAGGAPAALLYPMVNDYYQDTLEVIAPLLLKEHLGIKDGEQLQLTLAIPPHFSRPEGIIFDLDGTLMDSVDLYYSMLCEGCHKFGVVPPLKEKVMEIMGNGLGFWETWEVITGDIEFEGNREELQDRIVKVFEEIWDRRYENEVKLFSGVKELLQNLQRNQVTMGVVTSSFYIWKMDLFKKVGLDPDRLFKAVVTRKDTVKNKPDPEPIYRCLEKMDVSPTACICVGDSTCDVAAGREAGLFTVGVLTGTGTLESLSKEGADVIMDSVEEMEELLCLE